MQENDHLKTIIEDSNRYILELESLSNFFNQPDLYAILIRTTIIHKLFENNADLEINKLYLFHLQYTQSLIELLTKLKANKQQQFRLVFDEITIHEAMVQKMSEEAEKDPSDFIDYSKNHAQHMGTKLEQFYTTLTQDNGFEINWAQVLIFANRFSADYFRPITDAEYQQITQGKDKTYEHGGVQVETKLLGRLNRYNFKIFFVCGLISSGNILEVFQFKDTPDRFIFDFHTKSFYFLSDDEASGIDLSDNTPNRIRTIAQLKVKIDQLRLQLNSIKLLLNADVLEILRDYLSKISSVDFLEDLQNVDEQANVLRTMLRIKV